MGLRVVLRFGEKLKTRKTVLRKYSKSTCLSLVWHYFDISILYQNPVRVNNKLSVNYCYKYFDVHLHPLLLCEYKDLGLLRKLVQPLLRNGAIKNCRSGRNEIM